ncbi:MAG: hypothetical protein ACK5HL_04690 [Bacilli bacterium]
MKNKVSKIMVIQDLNNLTNKTVEINKDSCNIKFLDSNESYKINNYEQTYIKDGNIIISFLINNNKYNFKHIRTISVSESEFKKELMNLIEYYDLYYNKGIQLYSQERDEDKKKYNDIRVDIYRYLKLYKDIQKIDKDINKLNSTINQTDNKKNQLKSKKTSNFKNILKKKEIKKDEYTNSFNNDFEKLDDLVDKRSRMISETKNIEIRFYDLFKKPEKYSGYKIHPIENYETLAKIFSMLNIGNRNILMSFPIVQNLMSELQYNFVGYFNHGRILLNRFKENELTPDKKERNKIELKEIHKTIDNIANEIREGNSLIKNSEEYKKYVKIFKIILNEDGVYTKEIISNFTEAIKNKLNNTLDYNSKTNLIAIFASTVSQDNFTKLISLRPIKSEIENLSTMDKNKQESYKKL